MFSDILTPLPAMGIEFDVVPKRGPIIELPIRRCFTVQLTLHASTMAWTYVLTTSAVAFV